MYMHRIKKTLGAFLIGSALLVIPAITSAHEVSGNAKSGLGVGIHADGIVRVIGAEVSSVSNNVVNAFTTLGGVVMNWAVSIGNSTEIFGNGSANATTSTITAGEKISFSGRLTGVGSTLQVSADTVSDMSAKVLKKMGRSAWGEVTSVNSGNASFVLEFKNQSVVVETNSDTDIMVEGEEGSFGSIVAGDEVRVAGTWNSDTSVLTATKIAVNHPDSDENDDEDDEDNDRPRGAFRLLDRIFAGFGGFWR